MSRTRRARLALMLGALSALGPLAIDIYLPALPTLAADLETRFELVQLTLTVFVVTLAVGQVLVGPLSDAWGRRPLLMAGLAIFVAGSLACALAPSIGWLIGARAVQAVGAAAGTVLARAIVRDLLDGVAMARFFSTLMLVNGVAPVVAPVVGGQVLVLGSWHLVFVLLALAGAVLLVVVGVGLPESLPREARRGAHPRVQLRAFASLCRDASYLRHVLTAALMFGSLFAYISGSSFVLQGSYGLTVQEYSCVFAVNGAGIMLLGYLNGVLVGRVATAQALLTASLLIGTAGGCGVLLATIAGLPLPALLGCLFVVVSMFGPVIANATSLALAGQGAAAGAASALQGLLQFLVGGAVASVMSSFGQGGPVPMGVAVCLPVVAALGAHHLRGPRPRGRTSRSRAT